MPTNRPSKSGRTAGRRIRRAQPASERAGQVAAGMMHLFTGTVMSALAGVRDVGAEMGSVAVTAVKGSIRAAGTIGADVGRLAIDAAEGAIHAADRITAAAGRAADNLVGATMSGVAGVVSQPEGRDISTEPGEKRGDLRPVGEHAVRAARKPLARSPQRSAARPASARRRRGTGSA
jgi:hypothetical protein